MTQDIELNALLAASDHALLTARAKHRRVVDTTVDLLRNALEVLQDDEKNQYSDYIHECIQISINELLKSKPEAGAWK